MNLLHGSLRTLSFLLLSGCIVLNVAAALVFLFRKYDNKRADYFFALLLLVFALTSLHHVFILLDIYKQMPGLLFVPIYYTLSFGGVLFLATKLRLFPGYRFIQSDAKHFILPVGQALYFLFLFLFTSSSFRSELGREFYSPFYGGLEMALYIVTFYLYLFGAYRYTQFRIGNLRKNQVGGQPLYEAFVIRRMLRVLIILFWINSGYIVTDFIMYELLQMNMHDFRGFTRFGEMSFAAMAGWVGLSGLQLLSRMPYMNSSRFVFQLLKKALKGLGRT